MSDMKGIFESQQAYFLAGNTRALSWRIEQLKKLKRLLKENDQMLIDAVYNDFKKPPFETFGTEIGLIINDINLALRHIRKWTKPKRVPTSLVNFPSRNYILKEPYGTVVIISPWNYPVQLCLLPLVGALSAGNNAIIKPSELTPHTSEALEQLVHTYFEPEVIRVFKGDATVSSALLELPFNYIFFTGSSQVGKIVMQKAAERLTPVTLELGGKSPCIVDETANLEVSARRIAWAKFVNAGQTCVGPDYLMIQESVKDAFLEELIKSIKSFFGQNPAGSPDFSRIINHYHFKRLTAHLTTGTIAYGGDTDIDSLYIGPTVLDHVSWNDNVMHEEVFGPIFPVLTFSDVDDAIRQVKQTSRPLAMYVFTNSDQNERTFLEQVSFGGGAINDAVAQLGNHHLSFGGVGASGFGSYHGKASFDTFSHQKSIMKKNFNPDIPLRYAPYNGKIKLLKTIFR